MTTAVKNEVLEMKNNTVTANNEVSVGAVVLSVVGLITVVATVLVSTGVANLY